MSNSTPEETLSSQNPAADAGSLPPPADVVIEPTPRRLKSRNRKRLIDGGTNPDELGPGTPVAIYTRVSSDEQIEGYSLAAQERACRAFAEQRGWSVAAIYADPGHSARNDRRPAFQRLITAVQEGQVRVVLVHKLDRFSRNIDHALRYFYLLDACDATIASVSEDFDFSTPQGRLFFRMLASFAQWYLENLSAETIKGKRERALQGLHNGRPPFGYRAGPPHEPAVQVPAEAAIVREAFEKYATGNYTDRQIAQLLNDAGFTTRKGRRWSKDTVRELLQNEFYAGQVSYRDELRPGRHEAIISPALFAQCQQVRREHSRRPRSHATAPKRVYLLHRIICCADCGRPLRMQSAHGHLYYKEASRERGLECAAAGKSLRMEQADDQVLALLAHLRLPADWQAEVAALMLAEDEQRRQAERRQLLLEQKRRTGKAFTDGALSEDEYEGRLRQIEAELARLAPVAAPDLLAAGLKLERIGEVLGEASREEQAELCQLLLEQVMVDLSTGQVLRLRPRAEFTPLFRLAAPTMGWRETGEGSFLV